jgi:hypothetical protein
MNHRFRQWQVGASQAAEKLASVKTRSDEGYGLQPVLYRI